MKNKLTILILGMFLLAIAPLIQADSIGSFKINEAFEITNYCITADCTYMNLTSITDPDGQVNYSNTEMTRTGQEFNSTYTANKQGVYRFKTCADPQNTVRCEEDTFTISNSGEELTTAKSISYMGLILFLFLLFLLVLVSIFKMENVITIFILFWVAYLLFFAITFICFQLADSYFINVEFLGTFFWIMFWILLLGVVPLAISSMAYIFYKVAYNEYFQKMVEKGMTPEEAFKVTSNKINPFAKKGR